VITSYLWPYTLRYGDPRHGTDNGYVHYRCRCPECRKVNALRQRQGSVARAERLVADPTLAVHGDLGTYDNWKCRCLECTAAKVLANATQAVRRRAAP